MIPLRLGFAGTPDFASQHLAAIIDSPHQVVAVLTQPDRRAGRGKKARPSAVKVLAQAHDLPVLQPATLRSPEALAQIQQLDLDALVVVAYGLILPQAVLDTPRLGCLNVHGSLLPLWRGAAPIQRAIEAGDSHSGVTIMRMDAGLDTGPMLRSTPCAISPLASSADLYAQLAVIGPKSLLDVLFDLPAALAAAKPQDDSLATHAAKITKEEALVDWHLPARTIARRIRAFNPAPGCYSFLDGQRVKIWAALPAPGSGDQPPGSIIAASERAIAVRCGEGELHLQRLQLPGAKSMSVSDVFRGRGDLFGPGKQFRNTDNS
ncbi:MAG: methionyl-tRNA formyltransferase [Congregibacter sp.]